MGKAAKRLKSQLSEKKMINIRAKAKSFGSRKLVTSDPRSISDLIELSIDGLITYLMLNPNTVLDILENSYIIDSPTFQLILGIILFHNDKEISSTSRNETVRAVSDIMQLMSNKQKSMVQTILYICKNETVSKKTPQESVAKFFGISKRDVVLSKDVIVVMNNIRQTDCKENLKAFICQLELLSKIISKKNSMIFKKKKRIRY